MFIAFISCTFNYIFFFLLPINVATGTGHLTVGKLYGGILIHDNWRKTKFGAIEELRIQVRIHFNVLYRKQ